MISLTARWIGSVALPLLLAAPAAGGPPSSIRVDQVGYPADAAKLAAVVSKTATRFAVHRLPEGEVVFRGALSAPKRAPDSNDSVRIADFSELSAEGAYEVRVAGLGASPPFQIRKRPYGELLHLAMRSFYGQRCGTAVDLAPTHPGFAHEACHLAAAFHRSSGRQGGPPPAPARGWHDAGDYGRYTVNSAISTGTLLWAWEIFPEALRNLDLSIPESGDETPDLLDEIRWNLDWMLSMQDSDGGVWHKQTSEVFPPMVAPEDDPSVSYVIGTGSSPFKGSCGTAGFAATMAIAARVYAPFDAAFARTTRAAAVNAWRWLSEHPGVVFRNPEGVSTGEYGDSDCGDERLWAAAEIWRTTGQDAPGAWFVANADAATGSIVSGDPPNWKNVGAMAAWSYALSGNGDPALVSLIRRRSVEAADRIVERSRDHPYRIPLLTDDYVWGSNGVAANYGLQLLVANELRAAPAYRLAALEIIHYLLGRNPHSMSWITGAGTRPVMHPHHRPSIADGNSAPWPGLLAGGPNRNRQDPEMRKLPAATPPGMMYLDEEGSYATNETAINWNAALVFVLAGLEN